MVCFLPKNKSFSDSDFFIEMEKIRNVYGLLTAFAVNNDIIR